MNKFEVKKFIGILLMFLGAYIFMVVIMPNWIFLPLPQFVLRIRTSRLIFGLLAFLVFFVGFLIYLGKKGLKKFFINDSEGLR